MKKIILLLCVALSLESCFKVPISGRRQMHLLPESTLIGMSLTSYREFLTKNPSLPVTNGDAQMVKNVGAKIQAAVTRYLGQKKMSDRVKGFKWEFNLVNDNAVNAWCMPGGKVVVYSGLLPVTQNETGLAVVMGHEIAHAIARHGNERMSQALVTQLGGIALQVGMSQKPKETQDVFYQAYGIGSTLGTLKYSRVHESEADKMGLVFMAMAGYDPSQAIQFWERMSKQGGQQTLEILSTHPSDETRIKDIRAFLPQANKYYTKAK
jgi:predicted Zn-dependent protease